MKAITTEGTAALITPVEGALRVPVGVLGVFRGPPKRDILLPAPHTGVEDSAVPQPPIYRIILSRQQFPLRFPTVIPFPLFFVSLGVPKTTPHRTIGGEQFSAISNGPEKEFAEPEYRSGLLRNFGDVIVLGDGKPKQQGGQAALEENAKRMSVLVVRE